MEEEGCWAQEQIKALETLGWHMAEGYFLILL